MHLSDFKSRKNGSEVFWVLKSRTSNSIRISYVILILSSITFIIIIILWILFICVRNVLETMNSTSLPYFPTADRYIMLCLIFQQSARDGWFVFWKVQQFTMEIGSETIANDQRQSAGRMPAARAQRRGETTTRVQHSTQRGIWTIRTCFTYIHYNIRERYFWRLISRRNRNI